MTTNLTQFINLYIQSFTDYVTDPSTSTWSDMLDEQLRYNVEQMKVEEITLDKDGTYSLSLPSLATTQWHLIVVTCSGGLPLTGLTAPKAGKGYITTAGYENDGTTAITGYVPLYGVTLPSGVVYPGIAILSSYNWTSAPVITSQLDGSVFQIYDSLCVEDGG